MERTHTGSFVDHTRKRFLAPFLVAASFLPLLLLDASTAASLIDAQLGSIGKQIVGNRPDRFEPRAVKHRPKPIRLLNMTREEARASLRRGVDPYVKQK